MSPNSKCLPAIFVIAVLFLAGGCRDTGDTHPEGGGVLDSLARPQEGRSMRATSAMREGEIR